MRWTDLPPQIDIAPLQALRDDLGVRGVGIGADLGLDPGGDRTPQVLLEPAALDEALRSIAGRTVEQGGLLVGRVYGDGPGPRRVVRVLRAVPGAGAEASVVSVRLPAATWSAARAAQGPGECVVGWYHSHPGFGAFFSETDRATQAAFFREPWHLGWVIDPLRGEHAWFVGAHAEVMVESRLLVME